MLYLKRLTKDTVNLQNLNFAPEEILHGSTGSLPIGSDIFFGILSQGKAHCHLFALMTAIQKTAATKFVRQGRQLTIVAIMFMSFHAMFQVAFETVDVAFIRFCERAL